jgi:quercetin dioxygenase-like cupin family protein
MRAFKVEVLPHRQTLLHHHANDYLSVTLADAELENHVEGKSAISMKSAAGEVRTVNGPLTHLVKNVGDTPFRNVTVEILRTTRTTATGSASKTQPARAVEGVARTTKAETLAVRVFETTINAGVTVPEHTHSVPHLLIVLSDFELQSDIAGDPPQTLRYSVGDVRWFEVGLKHSVTNVGHTPARYVTVEFK